MRRVNESIREVLSDAIPTLKDPAIGFVTVTGVQTTTDLKQATVWVSVLGPERSQRASLAALERAAGVLQGAIGSQLRLRRTPLLAFAYDQSVARGVHMSRLIDELAPPDPETPTEDDDDGS